MNSVQISLLSHPRVLACLRILHTLSTLLNAYYIYMYMCMCMHVHVHVIVAANDVNPYITLYYWALGFLGTTCMTGIEVALRGSIDAHINHSDVTCITARLPIRLGY